MRSNAIWNYRERIFLLIAISTVTRLIIASCSELSNAEVYYWTYSRWLQLNYYDHPPVVAWLIRLTTANHLFYQEVFVRLGAIIASATCTWLIFKIGTIINNQQTGWLAALLYTSSIYGSLIAGTYILPDSPQMVFWLYSILLLIKISHTTSYDQKADLQWCLFGIISGLCIMSKVHGLFLWLGVALYALMINRAWLQYRGIYLSALITLVIISPIIIWNIQNNFISYKAYSGRVSLTGARLHAVAFSKSLLQVMVITNPVNFFLICSSLLRAFKGKIPTLKKDIQLILFCSLPLIIVLLIISLFRDTLAHWPGPAYSCLLILPAIKLALDSKPKRRTVPTGIKLGLVFIIITALSGVFITNYYPGTLSAQKEGLDMGTGDPTLDDYGWEEAGKKFDSLYKNDVGNKMMPPGAPIVVDKWFPAAHIDFYIATKTKQQTIGIGNVADLGHYYWMNNHKKPLKNGDSAYFIVPSNLFTYKSFDKMIFSFDHYEMPLSISQFRSGVLCKQYYIFRLKGYKSLTPNN